MQLYITIFNTVCFRRTVNDIPVRVSALRQTPIPIILPVQVCEVNVSCISRKIFPYLANAASLRMGIKIDVLLSRV